MSEIAPPYDEVRQSVWIDFLNRPLSKLWSLTGWIVTSSVFILLTRLAGGVTTSDSFVSVNSTLAIAHGDLSCAYPPQATLGNNPLAPPLYPLISGGLSSLFRIGHALPFPGNAQFGANCSHSIAAMGKWIVPTGALFTVVILGYVGWLFLSVGFVALLRASGRGRCNWEIIALLAVACAPPVIMCLNEYFHPQDLIAVGLSLGAAAGFLRKRWLAAGILLGLAYTSQQFALLFLVPLLFIAPCRSATRLVAGFLAAVAIVDGPFLIISSGRASKAMILGTGVNTKSATLLVLTHLSGNSLFALSRTLPLLLAAALALLIRQRRETSTFDSVTLVALLATSLTLRLVFEINLWGYYFMAVTVLLIALQVVQSRVNWWFVLWLCAVTYASITGGLANRPTLTALPMSLWQVILVPWALTLSLMALRTTLNRHRRSADPAI